MPRTSRKSSTRRKLRTAMAASGVIAGGVLAVWWGLSETFSTGDRVALAETEASSFVEKLTNEDPVDQVGLDQHETFEAQSLAIMRSVPVLRSSADRERLVARLTALETAQERQLVARAQVLATPLQLTGASGERSALIGFEGNRPLYMSEQNADAAVATGATYVRQSAGFDAVFGPGIDGAGLGAGVFELGAVYSHAEFALPGGGSRVVTLTTADPTGHGSHVGGTIGAQGLNAAAKGMAPAVTLYSWYQESAAKYASQAIPYPGEGNMVVTNTSLGTDGSGRYTSPDQSRDEWARLFPYTIMFQCAGNAGSGFETLNGTTKEAKNHFTVGNVVDVSRNASGVKTGGGGIVSGSSRGPSDDGRIKPDIVANGNGVYSIGSTEGSYGTRSGTSMSTPNATGSAVLLQDYFSKRFPGHLLRSDTLKGLIIHTVDDGGRIGPDYIYGHGLMNVHAAAKIIKAYADQPAGRQLAHVILKQGETHTRTLNYSGTGPIRVTLAWLDPVGPASRYDDDRLAALVNDLDVRVVAPSGAVHLPWAMPYVLNGFNAADRAEPAVRADNTVDNAEVVLIDAPVETGAYTIRITHKGTLQGGEQGYSLIHSGFVSPASAPAPELLGWSDLGGGWFELAGANFMLGARVAVVRDGTELDAGKGLQVAQSRIISRFDTPPPVDASFLVVNPDGQASLAEFSPPSGVGIILGANEATWTYAQTFNSLTRVNSVDEPWVNDADADGAAGLRGWYASYHQADGTANGNAVLIRADNGTTGSGRLYSYGANTTSADRALGSMRQDSLMEAGGSVRMGVRFVNRTGRRLTGFSLRFHGEQWRRSSNAAAQYIDASYAVFAADQGTLQDAGANYASLARFETLKSGSFSGNLNGNDASNRTLIAVEVDDVVWEHGQELWIRWVTPNFPNFDAGLAIDDVVFTARWTPEPSAFELYVARHGLSGTDAGPWAILSGDGLPNVLKFALGKDPRAADGADLMPKARLEHGLNGAAVTLTFSLGNSMNWDRETRALHGAGIILWLEQSVDLHAWLPATMEPVDPAYREERVLMPAAAAHEFRQEISLNETPRLFFRLRVEVE
ncbi:MAG: S8 family serine peptidase [Rariglobus sp.]